jgi:threonine dehydratase
MHADTDAINGNAAVDDVGKMLGIPITCVMPTTAPFTKVDRCRKFGANVILHGE